MLGLIIVNFIYLRKIGEDIDFGVQTQAKKGFGNETPTVFITNHLRLVYVSIFPQIMLCVTFDNTRFYIANKNFN